MNITLQKRFSLLSFNTFSLTLVLMALVLGANAQVCFTPAVPGAIAVGNAPQSIVTADFNNDGFADLATSNDGSSTVSVMLGNGNGTFKADTNYSVVNAPYSLLLNDFNGDGIMDIATTNLNSITILLGDGAGKFGTAIVTPAGGGSQVGVSADFNNDGKADYIEPDGYSNATISVVLGNGNGTFGAVKQFNDGGVSTQSIVSGDFDGDGNIDIAIVNQISNDISIMKGDGLGNFSLFSGSPFAVGATPTSVITSDFNGDGKLDLAVANYGDNNMSVFLGNGNGTFGSITNYPVGVNPRFVSVGDLNGDGQMDLVTANQGTNDVTVYLGTGSGTFTIATNCCGTTSIAVGNSPYQVAIADFDSDGRADMAVANRGSNSVSILLNLASGNAPAVKALANTPVCTNGTLVLTGAPGSMKKYAWSGPNGFNDTTQSPSIINPTLNEAGVYTLTVTDSLGCNGTASTPFVIIDSAITANAGADLALCSGASANLSATGGSNYSWSPSTGLSCNTCANPTANPTITTTYVFTGTQGGCVASDSLVITVSTGFILNSYPSDTTICSGNVVAELSSGASSYSWSPSAGLSCITCANPLATPIVSTTYTVIGFKGSCSNSDTVIINVGNTAIAGTIAAIRDTLCQGSSGSLVLSGNSSNIIQWQSSITPGNFKSIPAAVDTTYQTNPLQQTTWFRVVIGNGNCSAVTDSIFLFVPPSLTAFFNFSKSGSAVTFNSDSSAGNIVSYNWNFGDGTFSNLKNPVHNYSKNDTGYNVCLTIYDGSNCSYTFCKDVNLAVGIVSIIPKHWKIYPVPFSDNLFVNETSAFNDIEQIEIYDELGRIVYLYNYNKQLGLITLNLSALSNGMYCIKIKAEGVDFVQPIIKQ